MHGTGREQEIARPGLVMRLLLGYFLGTNPGTVLSALKSYKQVAWYVVSPQGPRTTYISIWAPYKHADSFIPP